LTVYFKSSIFNWCCTSFGRSRVSIICNEHI